MKLLSKIILHAISNESRERENNNNNQGIVIKDKKMLPKFLYELLPFLYLSVGIGGGVAINSVLVFIASVLLMAAGILVLTMRISYRREIRRQHR